MVYRQGHHSPRQSGDFHKATYSVSDGTGIRASFSCLSGSGWFCEMTAAMLQRCQPDIHCRWNLLEKGSWRKVAAPLQGWVMLGDGEMVQIVLQMLRCFKCQDGFYFQFIPSRKCVCVSDGHGRRRLRQGRFQWTQY